MSKYFVDKKYFFLSFLTLFTHILNFSLCLSLLQSSICSVIHVFVYLSVCLSVCLSDISLSHASFLPSLFFSPHPSLSFPSILSISLSVSKYIPVISGCSCICSSVILPYFHSLFFLSLAVQFPCLLMCVNDGEKFTTVSALEVDFALCMR